jgi:hypothetical protein
MLRPTTIAGRSVSGVRALVAVTSLALLLAACGGGNNGDGNGTTDHVLSVLVTNKDEAAESHTASYSGGAPLAESEDDEVVETCTAAVLRYALVIPFELSIDGAVILSSDDQPILPFDGESDLLAYLTIGADGVAFSEVGTGNKMIEAGHNISPPAALGICN